jgi:NADPH-dependent ferric siderophore reductase
VVALSANLTVREEQANVTIDVPAHGFDMVTGVWAARATTGGIASN